MEAKLKEEIKQKLGFRHHAQALFFLPRKFLDLRFPIAEIGKLHEGSDIPLILKLRSVKWYNREGKLQGGKPFRASLEFSDRYGQTIYGSTFFPFPWMKAPVDEVYPLLSGIEIFNDYFQVRSPEILPPGMLGSISTIYPAERSKVSSGNVREYVLDVLKDHLHDAADFLCANLGMKPDEIENEIGMSPVGFISSLHRPATPAAFDGARKAAKQLAIREIINRSDRIKHRHPNKRSILMADLPEISGQDSNGKPIAPTLEQLAAIEDILKDFRSGYPMRRLLSGDVGTGKTLVFATAAASAYRAGAGVAIMTPNEPLVHQIIQQINRFFPDVVCMPVTGKSKLKKADMGKLKEPHVLVGTSALCNIDEYQADFVVVDEQHKFSREQREAISGPHTHILDASATAIPRSMALVTHGGMDVSILKDSPVSKQIVTEVIGQEDRGRVFAKMREAVSRGKRVLIVYSLVVGNEKSDATTVEEGFERWEKKFPGLVSKAHGKMKSEEKIKAIDEIKRGDKLIMVASSVAEVGLDIPDLEILMVNRPQCYGLSQLHQLRGRLARNGGEGFMYLFPEVEINEDAMERLRTIENTLDGFEIAERDLEMRGFGDTSDDSLEQSGAAASIFRGVVIMPSDMDGVLAKKGPKP